MNKNCLCPRAIRQILLILLLAGSTVATTRAQTNLIVDGGFESSDPMTTPGEFQSGFIRENVGATFGGPNNNAWTVVQAGGISGDVAITSTTEYTTTSLGKTYYNANSGLQWLDLTGDTDNGAEVGVQQVIPTVAGVEYQVGFYLGSNEGAPAAVELEVDGASVGTFTNTLPATFTPYNGDGVAGNVWQQFTTSFTATGASTTLTFYNAVASGVGGNGLDDVSVTAMTPSTFFAGQAALSDGVYYLSFSNGNYFGYYSYLTDPHYIYHFDLGYEYVFDADDGNAGVYFYDFKSNDFFYTSPEFMFPYLYDFGLNTVLYYYSDPSNAGRYNTDGVRYFYDFTTGQIISK